MAKTNVLDLSAFLKENVESDSTKFIELSDRFKGKDGSPMKWEIRIVSADDERLIEKKCTNEKRDRRTGTITQIRDDNEYITALAAHGVVFPDLKDKGLQNSWGVSTAVDLLRKMLTPGELVKLSRAVLQMSGLGDVDMDEDLDLEDGPASSIESDANYAKN